MEKAYKLEFGGTARRRAFHDLLRVLPDRTPALLRTGDEAALSDSLCIKRQGDFKMEARNIRWKQAADF